MRRMPLVLTGLFLFFTLCCTTNPFYPRLEILSPVSLKADSLPIELSWEKNEFYDAYLIEIAHNKDFETQIIERTLAPKYSIDSLPFDETRYWRVRGITKNDVMGPWSTTHRFVFLKTLYSESQEEYLWQLLEEKKSTALESALNEIYAKEGIKINPGLLRKSWYTIGLH